MEKIRKIQIKFSLFFDKSLKIFFLGPFGQKKTEHYLQNKNLTLSRSKLEDTLRLRKKSENFYNYTDET